MDTEFEKYIKEYHIIVAQRYLILLELLLLLYLSAMTDSDSESVHVNKLGNILQLVWKHLGTYKACKSPDTSFLPLLLIQLTLEQIAVSTGIHTGHGE
jgi:hypothetical protein